MKFRDNLLWNDLISSENMAKHYTKRIQPGYRKPNGLYDEMKYYQEIAKRTR
ncbi:hypothetical protein lbkm_2078 [Lachnospiraceae bacterium KM106-2]|nr:hypothetical protein lbkm_2078 [Lachnospiraceae bacterium KM106-2]